MPDRLLAQLLDRSLDGIFAFDLDCRVTVWNGAMARIFGIEPTTVVGKTADDLPFFVESLQPEYFRQTLAGQSPVVNNHVFSYGGQPGGRLGFFDAYFAPLTDDQGEVSGGMAIVRDVTAQRDSEGRIDESERRFKEMADLSPVLLWMAREDSLCTFFNESWLKFTGRTLDRELGVGWVEGVHFADFQRCIDMYEQAFCRRQVFEIEYRLRRADGKYRWVLDRGGPRYDRDGIFRGFIGSCVDITDRRDAEMALRASLDQLETLVANAGEGIVFLDEGWVIRSFNPAAEQIFGYSQDDVLGKSVNVLELGLSGPHTQETSSELMTAIRRLAQHAEVIGRRKNTSTFPMEVTIGAPGGEEESTTLILRDISERRSIERLVLEASEELQRRIGQDLHDGLGQLLTGTAFLAKDIERALGTEHPARFKRVVDLLNQAIEQVRSLAKGLSPLHLEKHEITLIMNELARDTNRVFGIDCRFTGVEPIGCDDLLTKTHLYRIAREAVLNAIKHGGATRVDISLQRSGERFALSIRDNGSGIEPETTGNGIGLPSMRYRARMLGGHLEIGRGKPNGAEIVCLFSGPLAS